MKATITTWTLFTAAVLAVQPAWSQQTTPPAARELARFADARALAIKAGPLLWPGFRPDTIPLQLVLSGRGTVLLGWKGIAPEGYKPIESVVRDTDPALWRAQADRGAASTSTAVGQRSVAQVVVGDTSIAALAGLIAHESFHAFERSVVKDGIKFGGGENSYYVSQYPVYDVENETQFALELAVLRDALNARTADEARRYAKQFVAVRTARQHRMDVNVAEFEAMSELNEGLAEYALVRASALAARSASAAAQASDRMSKLLSATNLSVRLRYYVTGSGQALVLDSVGPADWKTQLMHRNITMQELLAEALGAPTAPSLIADAEKAHPKADLERAARTRVQTLQAAVRARADSLMHVAGVHFTLDAAETGVGSCGFDPQNMLQLGGGALLHTRWLKACQHGIDLEFNTAVVQNGKQMDAVIGNPGDVTITADGSALGVDASGEFRNVRIVSRGVTGTIAHARVVRTAGSVTIIPLTP